MNKVNGSMYIFQREAEKDASQYLVNNATTNTMSLLSMYNNNETEPNFNASNLTSISADWRDAYKPALDALLMAILIVVMLSMGCEVTWQNLLGHVKKPVGLLIGIVSQFCIMPLAAFCILLISGITGLQATGVLLISCCPGGVLSNTFTYFCEGELPLSVAMTCASTVIAMGMMPMNIWLYGRHFESENLVIPYEKMAMSLISVTSPVVVGLFLKWKFPRLANYITKVGGYSALIIMFVCIAMEIVLFPNMFEGVSFKLYATILSLPIVGLTLGYVLAYVLKQNKQIRKTIAIECGVQNVPVALTVVAMSFPLEMQEDIVLLPWMYGLAMMSGCTVICLSYHFCSKCSKKTKDNLEDGISEKKDYLLDNKEFKPNGEIKIKMKSSVHSNGTTH